MDKPKDFDSWTDALQFAIHNSLSLGVDESRIIEILMNHIREADAKTALEELESEDEVLQDNDDFQDELGADAELFHNEEQDKFDEWWESTGKHEFPDSGDPINNGVYGPHEGCEEFEGGLG